MANSKSFRNHYSLSGAPEWVELEYDFAKDTGAQQALQLLQVKESTLVLDCYTKVLTTFASLGSATMIAGVTGNTDAFMTTSTGAVASLTSTAGIIVGDSAGKQIKMVTDDVITCTIATADMTAGRMKVCVLLAKQA